MNESDALGAAMFVSMSIIGVTVVPKITKRAAKKKTKKKLAVKTSKIDFDNMGPEIVRKDHKKGDDK